MNVQLYYSDLDKIVFCSLQHRHSPEIFDFICSSSPHGRTQ